MRKRKKHPEFPNLVPPKVKRKIWRTLMSLFTILVILGGTFFVFGLKVRFLIGDELQVVIDPEQPLYSVSSNQDTTINFEIRNNNFFKCNSYCEFDLLDLNEERVVYSDHFNMENKEIYHGAHVIPANNLGNKLYLYNLNVRCNNVKSLICPTDEKVKHNSALFMVETEFTAEERNQANQLKSQLEMNSEQLQTAKEKLSLLQNSLSSFFKFSTEENALSLKLDELEEDLAKFSGDLDLYVENWKNSELSLVKSINLDAKLTLLGELQEEIDNLIILRESTITAIEEINLASENITSAYYHSSLMEQELDTIINSVNLINFGTFSESEVNQRILYSKEIVLRISKEYQNDLRNLTKKYSPIVVLKLSKDCNSLELAQKTILDNNITVDSSDLDTFIYKNCLANNNTFMFPNLTLQPVVVSQPEFEKVEFVLGEQFRQCCVFNECNQYYSEKTSPLLFIHGHSFNEGNDPESSLAAFAKIQEELEKENFVNVGDVSFDNFYSDLDKCASAMSMRATYYNIPSFDVGKYKVTAQKSERIENYALRLKEIINLVRESTGSDKITLVAHSMGGLVAREYIDLFGSSSLEKVIFVNVPHHGVDGKVKKYCSIIGASKECEDLSKGSVFLNRINSKSLPTKIDFFNIRSKGCMMDGGKEGDGIVTLDSSFLKGVEEIIIEGKCTDSLNSDLHNNVLDPDLYPETAGIILDFVKK
jgi:uncharacterized alpha/beta hydrolase family protein